MKPSTKKKLWRALGITAGAAALFGAGKYCYDRGHEDGVKSGVQLEAKELMNKLYDFEGYKADKNYIWPDNLYMQSAYIDHDPKVDAEARELLGDKVIHRVIVIGGVDSKMRDPKTIREDEKAKHFDYLNIEICKPEEETEKETEQTEKTEETEKTNWEE